MTIALPALGVPRKRKLDLSWPILVLFAALLCVLIIPVSYTHLTLPTILLV